LGGEKGKKFKYKPFQEILIKNANQPMEEQRRILDTTFENWKGDLEQVDDVLVVGVKI
jgi:serine phosphatase RsbU (regulator of sigma subunit)